MVHVKPMKIRIITSLRCCFKKIIKINIIYYFIINKKIDQRIKQSMTIKDYFNNSIK